MVKTLARLTNFAPPPSSNTIKGNICQKQMYNQRYDKNSKKKT